MVTISYDGDTKGNEYTYYSGQGWYCSKSRSWRQRNIKCYLLLASKLTAMAIEAGYCPSIFKPKPKPIKEKRIRVSKPKNFIPLSF